MSLIRRYDNECQGESENSHWYIKGAFGNIYLPTKKKLVGSKPLKGRLKLNFNHSLVKLIMFQLQDDVLRFLSCPRTTQTSQDLLPVKSSSLKDLSYLKPSQEKESKCNSKEDVMASIIPFGPFHSEPTGFKDFYNVPKFAQKSSPGGSIRPLQSLQRSNSFTGRSLSPTSQLPCKSCLSPDTSMLLDPDAWYENYKSTVTYIRIPEEHKKKTAERYRALIITEQAEAARIEAKKNSNAVSPARRSNIEDTSFSYFGNSTISTMPIKKASSSTTEMMYGPDAIASVSGYKNRQTPIGKKGTTNNRLKKDKMSNDTLEIISNDDSPKEMIIPMPSSIFRYYDDDYESAARERFQKSKLTLPNKISGEPLPSPKSTTTTGISSATKSSITKEEARVFPKLLAVNKEPAIYEYIVGCGPLSAKEYTTEAYSELKSNGKVQGKLKIGSGEGDVASNENKGKETIKSSGRISTQKNKEQGDSQILLSPKKAEQKSPSLTFPGAATVLKKSKKSRKTFSRSKKKIYSSSKVKPVGIKVSCKKKSKLVRRFKQSISLVSLPVPISKSRPQLN